MKISIENKLIIITIIITIVACISVFMIDIDEENRKEREFLNTQIVTIVDKEYKEPYTTMSIRPAMVGKISVMQPYTVHHSAQYKLRIKLDDGREYKISTFKLAYETVEIGKRYKCKDL